MKPTKQQIVNAVEALTRCRIRPQSLLRNCYVAVKTCKNPNKKQW